MSFPKSKRKPTTFEVEFNATKLRKNVTKYLLQDFAVNERRIRKGEQDLIPEEAVLNSDISETQSWFIKEERRTILLILRQLASNVTMANSIYITSMVEYNERRKCQDFAIGNCFQLLTEFQYIIDILPNVNVNKYMVITDDIAKEIALLRGWRKSDNKIKYGLMLKHNKFASKWLSPKKAENDDKSSEPIRSIGEKTKNHIKKLKRYN